MLLGGGLAAVPAVHAADPPPQRVQPVLLTPWQPPAVDSAVVRLRPLAIKPKLHDAALFETVVAAAFGQRRKTLRNALQRLIDAERLRALGIDPGARGETLSVGEFVAIANAIAVDQPA